MSPMQNEKMMVGMLTVGRCGIGINALCLSRCNAVWHGDASGCVARFSGMAGEYSPAREGLWRHSPSFMLKRLQAGGLYA